MTVNPIKYKIRYDKATRRFGLTAYRIQALRDFGDVRKGDLGGYIQSVDNLSDEGNCWVYDNACIFQDARVYGNATVRKEATVYGFAQIYDNAYFGGRADIYGLARVFGNATVHGLVKVYGHAQIFGNSTVCGGAWVQGSCCVYGYAKLFGVTSYSHGWYYGPDPDVDYIERMWAVR